MDKVIVVHVSWEGLLDLVFSTVECVYYSKYTSSVHTFVKPSRTLLVSVAKMNLTIEQSVESNTSEKLEAMHRIYGSVFATIVLPVFYFGITIFGFAGNCFLFFVILKLTVSNTFPEHQNLFQVAHKMERNSATVVTWIRCGITCFVNKYKKGVTNVATVQ